MEAELNSRAVHTSPVTQMVWGKEWRKPRHLKVSQCFAAPLCPLVELSRRLASPCKKSLLYGVPSNNLLRGNVASDPNIFRFYIFTQAV